MVAAVAAMVAMSETVATRGVVGWRVRAGCRSQPTQVVPHSLPVTSTTTLRSCQKRRLGVQACIARACRRWV